MKRLAFISVLVVVIGTCFTVSAFADFYVIPVQNKCGPCNGTRSAGGRWCDNDDGTVTDMTTCLVWLKYAYWGGLKQWRNDSACETCYDDAHHRAGSLSSGETIFGSGETAVYLTDGSGTTWWRLPTFKELVEFSTGDEYVSSSEMRLFEEVQPFYYWTSSSKLSSADKAHSVEMGTGSPHSGDKGNNWYVWPVRGGN